MPRFSLLLGEVGILKARLVFYHLLPSTEEPPLLLPDVSQITLLRDSVHP